MQDLSILSGTFGLGVIFFLIVLAILWFVLPFAIFGMKPILRKQIENQYLIVNELRELRQEFRQFRIDTKDSGSEESEEGELKAER
jgi:hypothetical protein